MSGEEVIDAFDQPDDIDGDMGAGARRRRHVEDRRAAFGGDLQRSLIAGSRLEPELIAVHRADSVEPGYVHFALEIDIIRREEELIGVAGAADDGVMTADRGETVVAVPAPHRVVGAETEEEIVMGRAGDVGAGAWGVEAEKLQVPRPAGDDLLYFLELLYH